MVIVRILGGLGNQLFQYAAARALAEKHATEVKLDITSFAADQLRNFDLPKLGVPVTLASPSEISQCKAVSTLQRLKARFTPAPLRSFYKEPHFGVDPAFWRLPRQVYLQGYFQSEMYFKPVAESLRKEIDCRSLSSQPVIDFADRIRSEESVALHIRRGDYKNKATNDVHGLLPIAYYQRAMALLKERLPAVRFYLFTDDPQAVANEKLLAEATIVSGAVTKNHFEDLYAMSQCRHNIIANSSFSWWAAWLNANKDKTVVAPKNWFVNGPTDTQDLLPASWLRL